MSTSYEDVLTISTPEGVDLNLTLAGVGSRFVSAIVDTAIQGALVIALNIVLVRTDGFGAIEEGGGLAAAVYAIANFLVIWGYDVLWEVLGGGRTPGKRLNGLRVVRAEGQPVTFVSSSIRNVLRFVDLLPGAYLVGIVSILVTRKNQRLGDIAAGTLVVRERRAADTAIGERGRLVSAPPGGATALDTSALTEEELAAVQSFLERRFELEESVRYDLGSTLAARLAPKVRGAAPDLRGERFLEAIFTARSDRAARVREL